MLSIRIVAVGGVKDMHIRAMCEEYLKRLKPFARVEIVEVAHEAFRDIGEKEKATLKEADRILKACADGVVLALEERGKAFTSVDFAKHLEKLGERGDTITFVIGGALGLHPSFTARVSSFSLSPLTFTHEMARLLLCEQLYRAGCIMSGKQYHY